MKLALGIEHVTNKYFPLSNSSREVRDKLVQACVRAGVEFRYETSVESLRPVEGGDKGWALRIKVGWCRLTLGRPRAGHS